LILRGKLMIRDLAAVVVTVIVTSFSIFAGSLSREELAARAASADEAIGGQAVKELRAIGQPGLDALFDKYSAQIEHFAKTGDSDENWQRIATALDTVAMQKDAYASHLYWYTDLDEAKRAAKAQNKPILSLRLLGNLNEEFSCANSRLFRAVLYPNSDVSKFLRENYILHWKSVRPAPRVTIDFGDGRKIERTLTGNSIHYILDADGDIVDALPGLYSPTAFLDYLDQGRQITLATAGFARANKERALMKYRKQSFDKIKAGRDTSVNIAKVTFSEPKDSLVPIVISERAVAKAIVTDENSILRVYDDFAKFEPQINLDDWNKLARVYSPSPKLDANSIAFVRRQNAKTGLTETEFAGLFAKLDNFIALDTTRNDFLFHTKLYQMLNDGNAGDIEQFNTLVYARIFKTPNTDKWLGLYSPDVYTALDGNGFIDR